MTTRDDDELSIFDRWSTFHLGDGLHAVEGVNADGSATYWLLGPDFDPDRLGPGIRTPRHEDLGPLPGDIAARARSWLCGAPCRDGHPCRIVVSIPGSHCKRHTPRLVRAHPGLWAEIILDGERVLQHRVTGEIRRMEDTSW